MILYQILLFVHVTAAVTMFAAWGGDVVVLSQLRRAATPAEARAAVGQRARWGRLAPASMLTTLGTGIWMMWLSWGPQAWLIAAVVGLVAIIITGVVPERREAVRLASMLADRAGSVTGAAGASDVSGGAGASSMAATRGALVAHAANAATARAAHGDMTTVRASGGALLGWLALRVAIGIGIVALMTAKPAALATVQILAAAIAIGVITAGALRKASVSGSAETALY